MKISIEDPQKRFEEHIKLKKMTEYYFQESLGQGNPTF